MRYIKEIQVFLTKAKSSYTESNYFDYRQDGEIYQICRAQLDANKVFFEKFWSAKIKEVFFELNHPFDDAILTRAVNSIKVGDIGRAVFMIDKQNTSPWIFIQFTEMINAIITSNGIFVVSNPWLNSCKNHILPAIEYFGKLSTNQLIFKDIEFGFSLHNTRPAHFFFDNLAVTYNVIKYKKIEDAPMFFIAKEWKIDKTNSLVYIFPNSVNGNYSRGTNAPFLKTIYKEVMSEKVLLQHKQRHDIVIWIGLAGEKRGWLEQINGIIKILLQINIYFKNIKLYFDGMTSYQNIQSVFEHNALLYEEFLLALKSQELYLDIECLIGKNYKEKIICASNTDIVIADIGTTTIACCEICKRPTVGFFVSQSAAFISRCLAQDYDSRHYKYIDSQYVQAVGDTIWDILKSFHIPWEHVYNLTAELLEEVKSVKMHRLNVPLVSLVARQYELEQELGIEIPIESVALCDKIQKQISVLMQNQEVIVNKINANISSEILLQEQKLNSLSFTLTYGTATNRIKNQLSYKLGRAMIDNSKSLWGYIRMPYVLSYIRDIHNKEQMAYNERIKKNPSLKLPSLESYPDYKEALKCKEHLSYKLGQAMIEADKNWYKGGYVKLWFEMRRIKKNHYKY